MGWSSAVFVLLTLCAGNSFAANLSANEDKQMVLKRAPADQNFLLQTPILTLQTLILNMQSLVLKLQSNTKSNEKKTTKLLEKILKGLQKNKTDYVVKRIPTLTYSSAAATCKKDGKELCPSYFICRDGKYPVGPVRIGNHWVPVKDDNNQWIQIGFRSHETTCELISTKTRFPLGNY
ncbi:uncharacterized protein LOC124458107 [Xenia sp. Carnegie-2017]|uniref:uncharacterized protein LOC124458107 n=1 Tax=Xenia sp. Carnegie-2017 TaxID=2897299 RepID=UPI001F0502A5|nr:uncharacterized protein LOC124458107 [Xenia sp. Carnegie-2017]XP_046864157.1 uncharacterized protein LOC124458107 [Xenia sp. Carnegie-2017]